MSSPYGQDPYQQYQPSGNADDTYPVYSPPPAAPEPYPPAPYSPAPGPYSPQPPQQAYPGGAGAPFGYDPVSGRPYSDKTRIVAGLLQLLPGFFFGLGGIGRLYAGNTGLGIAQIATSVVGWIAFFCGLALGFPLLVTVGAWLWAVIDGIVLLAGRPVDGQGRPLRS